MASSAEPIWLENINFVRTQLCSSRGIAIDDNDGDGDDDDDDQYAGHAFVMYLNQSTAVTTD